MAGIRLSRPAATLTLLLLLGAALAPAADRDIGPVVRPEARAQTDHVPSDGDAADDPAIWVHPSDPERSLVIGTDKRDALHVYTMDGRDRQTAGRGTLPNNVDVLYGFRLGGKPVDLAVCECRATGGKGVKIFRIDADTLKLEDVTAGPNGSAVIPLFEGVEPYGSCVYHSHATGQCYYFVNAHDGRIGQHLLHDAGGGKVGAKLVRVLKVNSVSEGCVADDELGRLYVGEEGHGIWRFHAEPDAPKDGVKICKVGEHGLAADVEGLTLYRAAGGKGHLIASSQGNNTFKVFERGGENRFLLTIDPKPGKGRGGIDDVADTDGIAVTNRPTSRQFPKGVLVVQDGDTPAGRQNFKLYAWEDIAGPGGLLVDPDAPVRAPPAVEGRLR